MHIIVYRGSVPVRFIDAVHQIVRIGLHEPGLEVTHGGGVDNITIGNDKVVLCDADGEVCRFEREEAPKAVREIENREIPF